MLSQRSRLRTILLCICSWFDEICSPCKMVRERLGCWHVTCVRVFRQQSVELKCQMTAVRSVSSSVFAVFFGVGCISQYTHTYIPSFVLYTHVTPVVFQAAFDKLDSIYGTYTEKSDVKSNFQLPRHCMTNTDLNRIINSDEVCPAVYALSFPFARLGHVPYVEEFISSCLVLSWRDGSIYRIASPSMLTGRHAEERVRFVLFLLLSCVEPPQLSRANLQSRIECDHDGRVPPDLT